MIEEERIMVDPNKSDLETLATLPGVGAFLAQRILDGRPYKDVEDLLRVRGLGSATLARMTPYLTIEADVESISQVDIPSGEEGDEAALSGPEVQKETRQPSVRVRPRRVGVKKTATGPSLAMLQERLWLVASTVVISVILSILLTLSILGGINRTLDIGKHAALRKLENDISILQVGLEDAISRMQALSARLEALEGLSGRVQLMEDEFASLREEVTASLDEVTTMQTQIQGLQTNVETLSQSVDRFDTFLQGLRQLILDATGVVETEPNLQP